MIKKDNLIGPSWFLWTAMWKAHSAHRAALVVNLSPNSRPAVKFFSLNRVSKRSNIWAGKALRWSVWRNCSHWDSVPMIFYCQKAPCSLFKKYLTMLRLRQIQIALLVTDSSIDDTLSIGQIFDQSIVFIFITNKIKIRFKMQMK